MLLPRRRGRVAGGVPLRRVREQALAPVGCVRAVVVDAALAVDFLVSSTEAAQHVAAAKHRLLTNRPPTTSFGFSSAGFALIGFSFLCASAKAKQVGQCASQADADGQGDDALGSLHPALGRPIQADGEVQLFSIVRGVVSV